MTHKLNNCWTLWAHKIKDDNWSINSYHKIMQINTVQDFWTIFTNIPNFRNAMFFLMREDITPVWEDPKNREGGSWSFIIPKENADEAWIDVCVLAISDNLLKNNEQITGITINPKLNISVIKIWNNINNDKFELKDDIKHLNNESKIIYKKHTPEY
jgi:hypothetical protein